jgi:hypothetical protein
MHLGMYEKCLEIVWECLEGVWGVSGKCLGSVWGRLGKCLRSAWESFRRGLKMCLRFEKVSGV